MKLGLHHPAASLKIGLLVTLLVIGTGGSLYLWYTRYGNDLAPDSSVGFGFAIAGTACFILAAICYTLYRRKQRRVVGQLNGALHWHACFALMGFALIMMHSFGNFNAKTGTYALYALVTLLVSGFVGRLLDHFLPHLIAREVDRMLTTEGEDRIESMARNMDAMVRMGMPPISANLSHAPPPQGTREGYPYYGRSHFVSPSVHSRHPVWGTGNPLHGYPDAGSMEVAEVQRVQQALQRERCYRYILVYWRLLHFCLAIITIGLIIWHLVYVAQLLVPGVLQRG